MSDEPKPFTDEELKGFRVWAESAVLSHHHPDDIDNEVLHNEAKQVLRFLATIADLKKQAEITDDLKKGVIASAETYEELQDARKRIEELEKDNLTLRTHFLSQLTELRVFIQPAKKTLERAMHIICNNDPEQENVAVAKTLSLDDKISTQAATIERLRGVLGKMIDIDDSSVAVPPLWLIDIARKALDEGKEE